MYQRCGFVPLSRREKTWTEETQTDDRDAAMAQRACAAPSFEIGYIEKLTDTDHLVTVGDNQIVDVYKEQLFDFESRVCSPYFKIQDIKEVDAMMKQTNSEP
ncbi:unnamed protein product [Cylicostephanus goldi]|uniref:Uncharacterized protein n=1 Tax=Cylicostephanus goldi TaxID=71465 RepID=A0A3P7N4F7_CYLGO|nr:unnamed protein product [Cylicostephanus goldi]